MKTAAGTTDISAATDRRSGMMTDQRSEIKGNSAQEPSQSAGADDTVAALIARLNTFPTGNFLAKDLIRQAASAVTGLAGEVETLKGQLDEADVFEAENRQALLDCDERIENDRETISRLRSTIGDLVGAIELLTFSAYPAHGNGFVTIVSGDWTKLLEAKRAAQDQSLTPVDGDRSASRVSLTADAVLKPHDPDQSGAPERTKGEG